MPEPVASWADVVGLMIVGRGPLPDFTGVVRMVTTDWEDEADGEPVDTVHRVFVSRGRVRRESLEGVVCSIDGEDDEQWSWDDHDLPPVYDPDGGTAYMEDVPLRRVETFDWDEEDDERPVEPIRTTSFLGRRAWDVQWEREPRRLVVDDETGLVLHRSGTGGDIQLAEWLELSVGVELDDALFTWDGPVRVDDDDDDQDAWTGESGSRAESLDAIANALSRWDEVAALAADAADDGELYARLAGLLDVDRSAARAVADMQLRRAVRRSRDAIVDELAYLRSEGLDA